VAVAADPGVTLLMMLLLLLLLSPKHVARHLASGTNVTKTSPHVSISSVKTTPGQKLLAMPVFLRHPRAMRLLWFITPAVLQNQRYTTRAWREGLVVADASPSWQ
jgi:hypothetical protein